MKLDLPAVSKLGNCSDIELRKRIRDELSDIQPKRLSRPWSDSALFREDLGLDSLDLVEMVARLEQATGLYVPDADFVMLVSVDATANYIRQRLATAEPA